MISLGIDIGSFSIKVAKVRSLTKGYEVVSLSEYPLPQDPNKDTQIDTIEAIRDIVKRYWEEGIVVVGGAHQTHVSFRRKEFPFRERHKILKSLPFELEDDIPFSIENSIFEAKFTHFVGHSSHILAMACPKQHIIEVLQKFSDGGLEPNVVSVDGVAAASLFEEWRDAPWEYPENTPALAEPAQVDLMLDLGHKTTTVAAIKDGYLLDLRAIDWGGKDLGETISQRYSLHYLEALKELRKKGFILLNNEGATKEQIALSEVLKSSIDLFAKKLRLSLLDLQTLHNITFRQIILTGGTSQIRNLGGYLTQKIDIATNRLAKLDMVPQLDFATSPNNEIASVTAIGLAVEGLKRPKNPAVNFLKNEFAPQNQTFRIIWDRWGPSTITLAACFAILFFWGVMRDSFSLSNAEAVHETLRTRANAIIGPRKTSTRDIQNYVRDQNKKVKLKETIASLQGLNSALDILNKISSIAPVGQITGLNVTNFEISTRDVVIEGEAKKPETITQFESALKSLATKGKVSKQVPATTTQPGYNAFRFQIQVDRQGKN